MWLINRLQQELKFIKFIIKDKTMNQELLTALQGLATQYGVEIAGTVTPVVPAGEAFDVKP